MRTRRRPPLRLVDGAEIKFPDPRSSVAAQAVFAGPQDMRVSAMTSEVTGRGYGVLSIRVGRVLIYLEDRRALDDWLAAVHEAEALSDAVFGPVMPAPSYRPRGS